MSPSLVVTEDAATLGVKTYFGLAATRSKLRVALPLVIGAGLIIRIGLHAPWPLLILPVVGLAAVTILVAVWLGRRFPQTWWFRNDSIHVMQGPVTRHIQWEVIKRWQLSPASDSGGTYVLTIWQLDFEGEEHPSTIMLPSDAPVREIERLLGGYARAV